jgi:PAT family beta-lactamase induction signal transducer AmpG
MARPPEIDHAVRTMADGSTAGALGQSSPVPAERRRALFWTSSTYFGEGLPWSFLHQMATEFLTAIGASNTQISSTSLLHLAVTFKFAWSPMVDLFGRKRTWVWMMQLLLGVGMLVVALVSSTGNLRMFWVALALLAIMHATHDIACDGFYLQALDRKGQALFSGTRNAAYMAALAVGSSALVFVAGKTSWLTAFSAAGGLMILTSALNRSVMPHPPEHHPQDDLARAGAKGPTPVAFWAAYRSFFGQPQAALVLSFMLLFRLGDIMMFAMSKPLLRDLGIGTAQRGILNGLGQGAAMLGAIVGGAIVARKGLERSLIPMTYIQSLAIPLYIGMAVLKPGFASVAPIVIAERFAGGLGVAAYSVFQMQRCRRAFSASHFALATVVVSLAVTVSGWISGPLNDKLGHPLFFTVAFIASWPSLVLVLFVPRTPLEPGV